MFQRLFILFIAFCGFAAHAEKYRVDPAHASVVFKISHLGFSNVFGMFDDVSGTFDFNEKKPESNKLDITIKTASVSTHVPKRDEHLRSPDFFDVKTFPTLTLKSTSFKKTGANSYDVKALLTLHGVTKPVEFQLTHSRVGADPMGKTKTGGDTKFTIKRSDYGMKFMQGPNMVGDDVEIWVSIEGFKS